MLDATWEISYAAMPSIGSLHAAGKRYVPSLSLGAKILHCMYRAEKKGWYVVARYFFLALLSFSAWPCLAVA